MEQHIYDNINYTDVAKSVNMSSYNSTALLVSL